MPRKKKGTGNYFTEETQNAILKYPTLTLQKDRNFLYQNYIHKPLCKIAEVWYNKIDTPYIEDEPLDAQMDCVIFMYQQLDRFKKDKGKAFSYFSIIARNYYIGKNNKAYVKLKKQKVELFDDNFDIEDTSLNYIEINKFYQNLHSEFIKWIKDNYNTLFRVQSQKVFGDALLEVLENGFDKIDVFTTKNTRNEIYKLVEGKLTRPAVTKSINSIETHYIKFKNTFEENGTILPYKKNNLPEDKKQWIKDNFKNFDRRLGVTGMAKQFNVSEKTMKDYLVRENII